jgi:hypothetical protein
MGLRFEAEEQNRQSANDEERGHFAYRIFVSALHRHRACAGFFVITREAIPVPPSVRGKSIPTVRRRFYNPA